MDLSRYRPQSKLVTSRTEVARPRFGVVDAHNHLSGPGHWDERPVSELLDVLDQAGVEHYVDLDGGWGEDVLVRRIAHFKTVAPERFSFFGGVDWSRFTEHGDAFGRWAAERLAAQAEVGATGVKIWKDLGLRVRDHTGALVAVDDPRLDPIWETAGSLGLPVLIHVADPVAFFDPLDERNERWEELNAHPDWHFPSPPHPPFETIVEGFARLVERHPGTVFVGAHVGCYAENLAWVSALIDRCPNFYVDISARISELGRQPYTARRFFLDHADRILYGLDYGPHLESYRVTFRFLETADEYIDYGVGEAPLQGRWRVHGIFLPDDVLEKVYRLNARRVLGLDPGVS